MPDISVLMCVFNGESYLRDCIDSVLSQSDENYEFIIIDDGSTDGTPDILDSYKDPRMIVVRQENTGLTRALNKGLSIAKGKFIARIDADDECMPGRFFKQKKFLLENPEVVLVASNAVLIDGNGNEIDRKSYSATHQEIVYKLENLLSPFPHSSIFFRKHAIEQEGGYNNFFTRSQDYDLYLRLSEKYKLACLDEYLIKLRMSDSSLTFKKGSYSQLTMGIMALICYLRRKRNLRDFSLSGKRDWMVFYTNVERWIKENNIHKKFEAKKNLRISRNLFINGRYFKSLMAIFSNFRYDPSFLLYKGVNLNIPDDLKQFLN